jgi:isoleucyl-tRNA synthetase
VQVEPALLEILRDELNVQTVEFIEAAEDLVRYSARPNFRALGARFGKRTPRIADAVRQLSSAQIAGARGGTLSVEVDGEVISLEPGDMEIAQEATGDFIVEAEGGFTVALDPTLTPELRAEGLAREVVSRVQRLRKESNFEVADRIRLGVTGGAPVLAAIQAHRDFVMGETLARELELSEAPLSGDAYATVRQLDLDGESVSIGLARIATAGAA